MERMDNETKRYHKSIIWSGDSGLLRWYTYPESEWINMALYFMIPASRLGPFYKECGLNQNFDKDDLNPIVRHLKLQLLLDI
jgi:hypothetical protein